MRIAFYCDGTYNDPGTNNNVYRMAMATLQVPGQQQRFYDPGVGTDGCAIDRLFGGAFGKGLVDKVKDAYTQIAHAYTRATRSSSFGFSRGAPTPPSCVAGMIAICGLPCNPR